jgi:hypothetical protein
MVFQIEFTKDGEAVHKIAANFAGLNAARDHACFLLVPPNRWKANGFRVLDIMGGVAVESSAV